VAFLIVLPWAQVNYALPLLPLLALLGADFALWLWSRTRATAVLGAVAAAALVADFALSYPDLNLNGYQWFGRRTFAGRPTLGYRAVAQVGLDGVEQALRFALANVPANATLVTYVPARHLVRAIAPSPPFRLVDGLLDRDALRRADWVITCLNGDVVGGDDPLPADGDIFTYPFYDRSALERDFVRAYSVRRAFDLEVAAVWRRR
jgi:hypothetical protein